MKRLLFAVSICGLTHGIEPLRETLPPDSEVIQNAATGRAQLQYKGSTPLVFFRKGGLIMDAMAAVNSARLGLPTRSDETPLVKLEGQRQYAYSLGQMREDGRVEGQGWQLEEGAGPYTLMVEAPPSLTQEMISNLRNGKVERVERTVQLPYYYGRELKKIELKYVFKKIPGFEAKSCLH